MSASRLPAIQLYRHIRKSPMLSVHYSKDMFVQMINGNAGNTLSVAKLHLEARDEYARLLEENRIGVKRDEKQQIERVAKLVGLKVQWDDKIGK